MKENQVELKVEILSYSARPYTGKDGSSKVFKELLCRLGSTVVKFNVGCDTDFSKYEGESVTLLVEFYSFGNDISAKVRAVDIV